MKRYHQASPPSKRSSLTGRYHALRHGGGFVSLPTGHEVYIPPLHCNEAWHQDLVRIVLLPKRRSSGPSQEGRILEILERTLSEVSAYVHSSTGQTLYCLACDVRLDVQFRVSLPANLPVPSEGTVVLLAPERRLASRLWQARLLNCFGREDDIAVQEDLVKLNHEVPGNFPDKVLDEAAALSDNPFPEDIDDREDLRHLPLVTIDGADARDFDDAIHVEHQTQGWLLRVAIADVSHFVRPSRGKLPCLDSEAFMRGNSWYFPRSVEPMLPPPLSNGLCSLNPGEDRLVILVEIRFSDRGIPQQTRFAPAIMRSAARLTYDMVKAFLLDNDTAALACLRAQEHGEAILAMLKEAMGLYALLRSQRQTRGSLDFDLPEPCYTFDAQGRILSIDRARRHDIHRLIEEFMIAANEAVARHLTQSGLPFLYRVHPAPDPDRLSEMQESLRATAIDRLPAPSYGGRHKKNTTPQEIQAILMSAQGSDQEFLVNRLCLRALNQARYQPENEGHFGLASQAYCHFTSPIRRYADLLVHRVLKTSIGCDAGHVPAGQKLLRIADQLNRRERAAQDCEREIARRMACLALRGHEHERFQGVVSGLMDFGIFVELLHMPVEGMIRIEDLGKDWFELDKQRQCLVGQRSGQCWQLGQMVEVRLASIDMGRLEIRFMPLDGPSRRRAPRHRFRDKRYKQTGQTSSWPKPQKEKKREQKTVKRSDPGKHRGKYR